MVISVARLASYAASVLLFGLVGASFQPLSAQPEADREITRLNRRLGSLIRSINDIKWNNITIYRLEEEFRSRLVRGMEAEDRADLERLAGFCETIYDEPLPGDCAEAMISIASSTIGRQVAGFKRVLAQRYSIDAEYMDDEEIAQAFALARSIVTRREGRPKQFYLVTSRDKNPARLIALLGVNINESDGDVTIRNVWAGTDLYTYLHNNSTDTTTYSELRAQASDLSPSGLSNQMFTLRNLSEITIGAAPSRARAVLLDENRYQYVLTGVSEGRPLRGPAQAQPAEGEEGSEAVEGGGSLFGDDGDGGGLFGGSTTSAGNIVANSYQPGTQEYPYELSVGTDVLASFRAYDLNAGPVAATRWGVELENNFDELNYPGIWGGRMTLNAILENIKIGAVLPAFRFGDSTIATSGIGSRPQKIIGGYGISFEGDFTAPVIQSSGLFNFHGSYTFSEVAPEQMVPTIFTPNNTVGEVGYLVRYDFQAFYSFGFFADPAARHLFRLKVGGTVYGVEGLRREQDTLAPITGEDEPMTFVVNEVSRATQGGVAAAIEYMRTGTWAPFGARLQYVDNSLLSDLWIQFAIARNLDLKFDIKYFTPVFRDPHEWENPNLVVPSVTMRYHFGTVPR